MHYRIALKFPQKKLLKSLERERKGSTFASAFDKESHSERVNEQFEKIEKQTSSTRARRTLLSMAEGMKANVKSGHRRKKRKKKRYTMKSLILAQDER